MYKEGLKQIANQVRFLNKKYTCIVGLERGGVILAIHLSHLLKIPFDGVKWSSHEHRERDYSKLRELYEYHGPNMLIVDDIVDTGKTLQEITNDISTDIDFAALIVGENPAIMPEYFHIKQEKKDWVDFWWEIE